MGFPLLFALLLVCGQPLFARSFKLNYEGNLKADFAEHTRPPINPAAETLGASFQQNAAYLNNWTAALGFSAWNEFVYKSERFSGQQAARDDSHDVRVRNAFVQYHSNRLMLKLGNQQVVWGEAFGFFFSDIVNPKDLRNGLNHDFSDIRLQMPMTNAKFVFGNFSLQGLAVHRPQFNLLPSPGNDFAFPYQKSLAMADVQVAREAAKPLSLPNQEYGVRASALMDGLDLALFYFNYFDRMPWYTVEPHPTSLVLQEHHSRVNTAGLTATQELNGFVIRLEGLRTAGRALPVIVPSGLSSVTLDNSVYVVEIDAPAWNKFNFGVQWSQDILAHAPSGLLRPKTDSMASLHLQRPLLNSHSLELLYTYDVADFGHRIQAGYVVPLSKSVESRLGGEIYSGPLASQFGQISQVSRAFVFLKYFMRH